MKNIRHSALQPLSHEHHNTLELCNRIRKGLLQDVEPERIFNYSRWFWENYLEPHFELEQDCLFPLLGSKNVRVKRALANHRRLTRLFDQETDILRSLNRIEEELETYIRFEERILYKEIENQVSRQDLARIETCHHKLSPKGGKWKDPFWAN